MVEYFKVITFYQFINLDNLEKLAQQLKRFCISNKIRGSIILAAEGVNGTLAGLPNNIDGLENYIIELGMANLNVKYSKSREMPFYRLKIKIKNEIVTMLNDPIETNKPRAISVSSDEWNDLINQPDVIVLDVRNQYETEIGRFDQAVIPNIDSFIQMKKYIDEDLREYKNKKIAMYCTGGIRCEKASYYMKQQGFNEVFQLDGGILKYLEEVDDKDSLWDGECFVFDNRVALTKDLDRGIYDLCHGCNEPVSPSDKKSIKFEKDVSCPECYDTLTEDKKSSSRERSKQIKLSEQRNTPNVYLPKSPKDYL